LYRSASSSLEPKAIGGFLPERGADNPALRSSAKPRALIRIAGLRKRFANGTLALDGIDLDIKQGEFVSLLGPSGCGKSTLLRLIAGLSSVSEGTIEWPQSRYDAYGRPEPEIGFVFQEPTLMPWRTVAGNVALPLKVKRRPKAQITKAIAESLEMVGLGRFARTFPRQLSGGMKMRVSIARALADDPQILLMDEPFAALDEITRLKLNNDLLALWQKLQCTVVFVTHSVYESVFLSSRIIVMSSRPGRVIDDLSIDEPYPRTEEYRLSPAYAEHCRAVSLALKRAMAPGEQGPA